MRARGCSVKVNKQVKIRLRPRTLCSPCCVFAPHKARPFETNSSRAVCLCPNILWISFKVYFLSARAAVIGFFLPFFLLAPQSKLISSSFVSGLGWCCGWSRFRTLVTTTCFWHVEIEIICLGSVHQ